MNTQYVVLTIPQNQHNLLIISPNFHPIFMKKSIHPVLGACLLFLLAIISTGCPIGIEYPLCEESQVQKIDQKLLGTWKAESSDAEILEVKISKEDDYTFAVEVLEQGENYMADDTEFFSWTTKLDGHTFIFSQAANSEKKEYMLYEYSFEGKNLVIQDVSLLVGGVDAVTSTQAFRDEVSASLKNPDCLTARLEYVKQ